MPFYVAYCLECLDGGERRVLAFGDSPSVGKHHCAEHTGTQLAPSLKNPGQTVQSVKLAPTGVFSLEEDPHKALAVAANRAKAELLAHDPGNIPAGVLATLEAAVSDYVEQVKLTLDEAHPEKFTL
jgi:hypothetical protein